MRVTHNIIARALFFVVMVLALPVLAQSAAETRFDFAKWETTATRAEGIVEKGKASSPALETLRMVLVDFRSQAIKVQASSRARTATLQSQLDALGPAPTDGQIEAADIVKRRSNLSDQLAAAKAPVLAAQEAFTRANGIIGEIDTIIRGRIANQFFALKVSPLYPANWAGAVAALTGFATDIRNEVSKSLASDAQRAMTKQNLPLILGLLVLGLVLLTRARTWLLRLLGLVPRASQGTPNEIRALLLSTTQVIVPMLGVWAIVAGLVGTGMLGLRGEVALRAISWMALSILGGMWLGRTLFSRADSTPLFFWTPEDERSTGTRISISMGVVLALDIGLDRIALQADFPETAHIVLSFPIVLVAGILLIRMGLLLAPNRSNETANVQHNPLQNKVFLLLTRGAIALGAIAPALAAIGYFSASKSVVFPAILTLGLFGSLQILYRLLIEMFQFLTHSSGQQKDVAEGEKPLSLLPVAVALTLILAALPIMALIWGARVSDLQNIWILVNDGFSVGQRRISVTDFLVFAVVFVAGYTLTRLVQSALRSSVLPQTRLDAGGRNAILTGTGYLGITLSAFAAITSAGLDLSNLAIVAGALSVGIGFGLQAIVSNFVSGVILLIERPIKEGDWVEVGPYSGYVRRISVRSTEIETFDRATVVVPNADLISGTVTNWTHSNMNGRVKVPVGVAYDSDPEQVREILLEIAKGHDMVDPWSTPSVVFMGFGASSLDFEIRAILKDVNWVLSVKSDMNFEILKRFREAGIEIPFAQRDINLRNVAEIGEQLQKLVVTPK